MAYLVKHAGESFSSQELAELICVNPVQLRSVMRPLVEHQLVISKKGKFGGYSVDAHIGEIYLD
ncbi:DNA-binding IscR family transcriptional regulator [Streptococcus gallinaceus]|uniref:DNA-binding IscR family transcriptional regulator n=1 Tax=Streptococcus gallinaceus TaxID=165758 RepID=A0ABV2JKK2_9STRE